MKERSMYDRLWKELSNQKAMVFLEGPRQSGKTTFAQQKSAESVYTNWDIASDRHTIQKIPCFFEDAPWTKGKPPLVIFDEIHKYRKWKTYLKGVYDQFCSTHSFLVLGSGRLGTYQRGGDSLAGRYVLCTLFPFTIAELANQSIDFATFAEDPVRITKKGIDKDVLSIWQNLSQFSGFPEVYTKATLRQYRRWATTYRRQLLREDIRDLANIRNIDAVEFLFSLLPDRVGSPLSLDSLVRDVEVSHTAIRNWMQLFDRLFLTFSIMPWSRSITRAIKKEKKFYLFDYPAIDDSGARFENMVALELLRAVTHWTEWGEGAFELRYLRNKEGHEVDFLIVQNNKPWLMIEAKSSDDHPSRHLYSFQKQLNIPAIQLVNSTGLYKEYTNEKQKIVVCSAPDWLACLP